MSSQEEKDQIAHINQLKRQSKSQNEGWLTSQQKAGKTELTPAEHKAMVESGVDPGYINSRGFTQSTNSSAFGGSRPIPHPANPVLNPIHPKGGKSTDGMKGLPTFGKPGQRIIK